MIEHVLPQGPTPDWNCSLRVQVVEAGTLGNAIVAESRRIGSWALHGMTPSGCGACCRVDMAESCW